MLEDGGDDGGSFGGVHQAEEKDSVSISFDPSTGRVPATRGGIRSQDTSANERNPAQARIFKPRPQPREKNKKEKLLALWLCTVISCGDSLTSIKFPQTCRTGCWRPGAGVKGQGQVFELGGGGANRVSQSVCVCVLMCVVILQFALFCNCCVGMDPQLAPPHPLAPPPATGGPRWRSDCPPLTENPPH